MSFDTDERLFGEERLNHERFPELPTGPVSTEPYISEQYFEREREAIFKHMWLLAGRVEKIPEKGDFFVKKIEILHTSIIVVRGEDNKVRAFYNVCRHRGTNLASGSGNCKFFTCKFHGWVYDTEGNNRHIADESQFFDLDKSDLKLHEVKCDIWNGFIFVNFDENPRETLLDQLAELAIQLNDFPFEKMRLAGHWGATLTANWKLFIDAFQEGYHVATVHSGTIDEYFTGERNPYCRPSSVRLYDRNRSLTIPFNPNFRMRPTEKFAMKTAGASLSQGEEGLKNLLPGINPEGDEYFSFDINAIFPNWLLDTSIGFFFIHQFWPIDVNTTRWEAAVYFPSPHNAGDLISQNQSITLMRDAFREDIATGEGAQAGLLSGSLKEINFADSEITCRHLYETVDRMINGHWYGMREGAK